MIVTFNFSSPDLNEFVRRLKLSFEPSRLHIFIFFRTMEPSFEHLALIGYKWLLMFLKWRSSPLIISEQIKIKHTEYIVTCTSFSILSPVLLLSTTVITLSTRRYSWGLLSLIQSVTWKGHGRSAMEANASLSKR